MSTPRVILVPPLLMPSIGLGPLQLSLEYDGFDTVRFAYSSYLKDIPENGLALARFCEDLGNDEVDFITYSMGAIVLRWAVGHHPMPRIRRVVMIGPPNKGARLANWVGSKLGPLFPFIVGRSAPQLRRDGKGLAAGAGDIPATTEVGIIAGGTGTIRGFNSMMGEDNDRIVAVEETKLPNMADFILLNHAHGPLIFSNETFTSAKQFLREGRFSPHGR